MRAADQRRKLTAYANSLDKTHGKRKAIKALRYVANGSASSRETILTMLLTLPYRMGGYGLKQPLLNHRIDLGRRERRIAGKNYLCAICTGLKRNSTSNTTAETTRIQSRC